MVFKKPKIKTIATDVLKILDPDPLDEGGSRSAKLVGTTYQIPNLRYRYLHIRIYPIHKIDVAFRSKHIFCGSGSNPELGKKNRYRVGT